MRTASMIGALSGLALVCGAASADLIRADTATASSTFNGSYDIGNAIDGSGLPMGFGAGDAHANYSTNNHWTTRRDEAIGATATFGFDEAQGIAQFLLWNHRSNNIADDPNYAIRVFDLELLDASGAVLAAFEDLTAEQNVATAQVYTFDLVSGVSAVRLTVVDNFGSRLTGLAEVAFSSVPAPSAMGVLGVALAGAARRRR